MDGAELIFRLNMEAFPEGFNTYDSYGELMMNMGKNEEAIKYYKKSVELNPGNQNGIDMLKKLGVDEGDILEEVVVADEILESLVGDYELAPGFVLSVTKDGSQMKAQATGQPVADIFPKSDYIYYLKVVQAEIKFIKGDDGTIESLTLLQGGMEMNGKRL